MSASAVQVEREPSAAAIVPPSVAALVTTAIAGLVCAGVLAWLAHDFFRPTRFLPTTVRNLAGFYVLLVFSAAYATTRGILVLISEEEGARELPLRVGLSACWMAPSLLFWFDRSEWVVAAGAALAVSLFRLAGYILSIAAVDLATGDAALPDPPEMFASARVSHSAPDFFGAICAALLMQGTAAAIAAAKLLLGAGLALLSVYVLWRCVQPMLVVGAAGEGPLPVSHRRMSLRLSLAALLTLAALLPHMAIPGKYGGASIGGRSYSLLASLKALFGLLGPSGGSVPGRVAIHSSVDGKARVHRAGTPYPAVVLWSDEAHNAMPLVAPPPMSAGTAFGKDRDPLSIRFDGQYVVLRSPDGQPGPDSLVERGSPAKWKFVSNDYRPLWMEARQNFGTYFDRQCCRAIRLEVTDGDYGSRKIDLELVITDSQNKQHGSQSLGLQRVSDEDVFERPIDRSLTFAVPAEGLDRFDQVTVRYWLKDWHRFESARVAIRNFVLLPR